LRDNLEAEHGSPVYFPFFFYRAGEVRARQGYLAKFPVEMFDLLPELEAVRSDPDEVIEDSPPRGLRAPIGRPTRIQDPRLKDAIERRSLDVMIAYYQKRGAVEIQEIGKPYDIRLILNGQERHVEVKGSSVRIDTVELTRNEVHHAWDFQPTDLAVVDRIKWSRQPDGTVSAHGGELRVWPDWEPHDEDLACSAFDYRLPVGDEG